MSILATALLVAAGFIAFFAYNRSREREAGREYLLSLRMRANSLDALDRRDEASRLRDISEALMRALARPPVIPWDRDSLLLLHASEEDELRASGFIPGTSRYSHAYAATMRMAGEVQRRTRA